MVEAISQNISLTEKNCLKQQTYMRLLISEIELHCDDNDSRKETVDKIFLKVLLNVVKINSYELRSLLRLLYVLWKQLRHIIVNYMSNNNNKKQEYCKK